MGAPSKRAKRQRSASEFDLVQLAAALRPPADSAGLFAWELEGIRQARQSQMTGSMATPVRLAASMKTDSAIYAALLNRLAPQRGLPVELCAANETARAARVRDEGDALFGQDGIAFSLETLGDLHEQLVMHGFFVGVNVFTPRPDGSRVDVELQPWPLEHVRFNRATRMLEATTGVGGIEPIVHGNGRWVVGAQHGISPWGWGAVVPLALVWADRAYGIRDRSRASTSHGNAKMIGELPEGIPIGSQEGQEFLLLLRTMHEALPYGIRPHGAKTEMLVNSSTSWQIFKEIIDSNLSDAARVLNGHDGTVKAAGGNYVKDGFLFGVSVDIIEGDLRAFQRALLRGTIEPWCAINFGTSELAPKRRLLMPDADEDQRREATAARRKAFWDDLAAARAAGVEDLQAYAVETAKEFGLKAPRFKASAPSDPASAAPEAPTAPAPAQTPKPSPAAAPPLRAIR
jgi:hypothetical protein